MHLNGHCPDLTIPSVVPSEVMGGFNASKALIERGHRRIALIKGETCIETTGDRAVGNRRSLGTHDIPLDPPLERQGSFLSWGGYEQTDALSWIQTSVERNPLRQRPDGGGRL